MHVAMVLHPLDDAGMASGLRTCVCGRAELQRCLCSMFGRLGSPDTDDQERVAQVMRKLSETGTRRVRTCTKVERPISSILQPGADDVTRSPRRRSLPTPRP